MDKQATATYRRLKALGSTIKQAELLILPKPCQSLDTLATAMLYNKENLALLWGRLCDQDRIQPKREQALWEELVYIFLGEGTAQDKLTRLPLAELLQLADSQLTF